MTEADTAPLGVVPGPAGNSGPAAPAGGQTGVPGRPKLRQVAAGAGTLVFLALAVVLYRHGVRSDEFPPVLPGTKGTMITRYSPPWLTGAAAALLLAGLCFTWLCVHLVRRTGSERGSSGRGSQQGSPQLPPAARYRPVGAGDQELRSAGDQKAL